MRRMTAKERRRLEFQRIVWTAAQGATVALISAGVLDLTALQAAGVAALMATAGALSSLARRQLEGIDLRLGIPPK